MNLKKITWFSYMITAILFLVIVSQAHAEGFEDVTENEKEIDYLVKKDIIRGYEDGTFRPANSVKRLQLIQMILRDKGLENVKINPPNPNFTDIRPGNYGYREVALAVHYGIIEGKVDPKTKKKYFDPWGDVTRAQMAKILVNAYQVKGTYDSEFFDVKASHWAYSFVNTLAANGITVGTPYNDYNPDIKLTRAHFAFFLSRTINPDFRLKYEVVTFKDSNLEKYIRSQIRKPKGNVTSYNMSYFQHITIGVPVQNLTGLEYAKNLKSLAFYNCPVNTDFSPLEGLIKMESFVIWGTCDKTGAKNTGQDVDLSPLASLTNITTMALYDGEINDVEFLRPLKKLKSLVVARNRLKNIEPMSGLTQLEGLGLENNEIEDISPLKDLPLKGLSLSDNEIEDISVLSELEEVRHLSLAGNHISNVEVIGNLRHIEALYLDHNQIEDIRPLTKLSNLNTLMIHNNKLKSVDGELSNWTKLEKLNISDNQLSEFTPLSQVTSLKELDVSHNQISSIETINKLQLLSRININDNNISDISPLLSLPLKNYLKYKMNPLSSESLELAKQLKENWWSPFDNGYF